MLFWLTSSRDAVNLLRFSIAEGESIASDRLIAMEVASKTTDDVSDDGDSFDSRDYRVFFYVRFDDVHADGSEITEEDGADGKSHTADADTEAWHKLVRHTMERICRRYCHIIEASYDHVWLLVTVRDYHDGAKHRNTRTHNTHSHT